MYVLMYYAFSFTELKKLKLVVGISATMCHSAEKIPAKEYASHRGLAKNNKVSPPEYLNRHL